MQFLADEKVETLSAPRIMTISGQPALVEVGSWENGKQIGFRLSANPLLIADSNVIRLSHSVTIGEVEKDAQVVVHESLVGSGTDVAPDRRKACRDGRTIAMSYC